MTDFFAPCGHPGTPIIGSFVTCTVKGCNGLPKPDALEAEIRKTIAACKVYDFSNLKWHLTHPPGMPAVFVIDEHSDPLILVKVGPVISQIRPEFYLALRDPRLIAYHFWEDVARDIRGGSKKPTFDSLKAYVDPFLADNAKIGLVFDCIPVKAEVTHGRLGRELAVIIAVGGRKYERVDYL